MKCSSLKDLVQEYVHSLNWQNVERQIAAALTDIVSTRCDFNCWFYIKREVRLQVSNTVSDNIENLVLDKINNLNEY